MRGEVLHYDEAQGFGFISGADGNPYTFRREDLRRQTAVTKGLSVEFEANAGQAKGVYPVRAMEGGAAVTAGPAPFAASSHQFGRDAASREPFGTGLWGYFCRTLSVNYANFRGRARRKEYWGYFLFWMIGFTAALFVAIGVDTELGNLNGTALPFVTVIVSALFILATLVPGIAMAVRRMHDIGLSGWFYLVVFIPYIGSLVLFVFSLIPSQAHENKWGPVPEGVVVPAPYGSGQAAGGRPGSSSLIRSVEALSMRS